MNSSQSPYAQGLSLLGLFLIGWLSCLGLMHCGQPIAGGSSEMGNPTVSKRDKNNDSTSAHAIGIEFDVVNGIRILRKTNSPDSDTASSEK